MKSFFRLGVKSLIINSREYSSRSVIVPLFCFLELHGEIYWIYNVNWNPFDQEIRTKIRVILKFPSLAVPQAFWSVVQFRIHLSCIKLLLTEHVAQYVFSASWPQTDFYLHWNDETCWNGERMIWAAGDIVKLVYLSLSRLKRFHHDKHHQSTTPLICTGSVFNIQINHFINIASLEELARD